MADPSVPASWTGTPPDPLGLPALYDGLIWRRLLAYLVDILIIGLLLAMAWTGLVLLGLLTFGLLWALLPIAGWVIPLGYHAWLVGGAHNATLGMRLADLEVRTWTGGRPGFGQALLMAALFYATVMATCFLILVLSLLNDRRRTLHDYLSGVVVVRRSQHLFLVMPPLAATR
jgi:uncharacterized RDD family membrane protein YckC